ncbi:MAG: hypothetical protein GY854_21370 [Deltaproteobacteria bacterium]|nr:hypothetical protein [Deltaproteobacteria bacterium]
MSPHREGEYSGLIGFRDGTNAGFTFMRSGWTGDKFQYSTELLDLKGFSTDRRSIILDSVARIDFLEMTAAENREVAADHDLREVRKCNVSFRDGGKRDRIFISVRGMTWRGSRESGQVADASIRRIVFSEK